MKTENKKTAEASLRSLRISPSKLGKITRAITGMPVEKAIMSLTFSKMRISRDVKDLLKSAIANAENNHGLDIDTLVISRIDIGKAFVMKRMRPRAKGRGCRILKPFSRIRIVLSVKED